jgi:hypothetical protein
VCTDASTAKKCNGGGSYGSAATATKDFPITNRISMKVDNDGTGTRLKSITTDLAAFKWNQDLAAASFYHSTFTTSTLDETGSKWCSNWQVTLAATGDAATMTATNGLTGRTKCTWQMYVADGRMGPTIKITSADYVTFFFQWIEWYDPAGLGSNALLPTSDGPNYQLGTYANTAGEVFFNPLVGDISDAKWKQSAIAFAVSENDPSVNIPGTLGPAIYYPGETGPFQNTQTKTIDSALISKLYSMKVAEQTAYDALVAKFKTDKDTFNSKVNLETARRADAIKAAFDPEIAIPVRPCAPTIPATWSWINLNLNQAVQTTNNAWKTTFTDAKTTSYLVNSSNNNLPQNSMFIRKGFLQTATDNTQISTTNYAGRVFGRLG